MDEPIKFKAAPPLNWEDYTGRVPPPRQWWIQDWLAPMPTVIAGRGGVGKTTLMQTLCTGLATGKSFLGSNSLKLTVLMLLCEDNDLDAWRRQHDINRFFDLEYLDLEQLHIVPRLGMDNTLMGMAYGSPTFTSVFDEIVEQVNDLRVDFLVIDNIAQMYGANESDRHHVTKFVNGCAGMRKEAPFGVAILGHPGRGEKSEYSGSTAWENAVRSRWYLGPTLPDQKPDDEEEVQSDVMYLARQKSNYSTKDWRRFRWADGIFVPELIEPGVRFDEAFRKEGAENAVMNGFDRLKGMGIDPTDGASSPSYLPAQMCAKQLAPNHTKKELAAAMNRLMAQGKLVRQQIGQFTNRNPRFGLARAK